MNLKPCSDAEFKALVKGVRAVTPLPQSIRVQFSRKPQSEMEGTAGYCTKNNRTFKVVISERLSHEHTAEVLIHEVAHVLDWRPYHPWLCDHGPTFWVHYGMLWTAYHQVK